MRRARAAGEDESFRFRSGEPVPSAAERIARAQLALIRAHLRQRPPTAEDVHEVRKATKRLRALVRLLRDELGPGLYRRENRAYRDIARALAPTRDATVLADTLDRLLEHFADEVQRKAFVRLAHDLRARVRSAREASRRAARIPADVRRAENRLARWPVRSEGWKAIASGVRRIYRRGRAAGRRAARAGDVASFHEWRKRTKDLRYATELLEPVWPKIMRAFTREVDALAEQLGEDHDLTVLRDFLDRETERPDQDHGADREALVALIEARRAELQEHVRRLTRRVYAERARAFTRRVAAYWQAWRAEQRDAPARPAG